MPPTKCQRMLRHTCAIQVSIECDCGGGLVERPVLEHTIRLADGVGASLGLQQMPVNYSGDSLLANDSDPGAQFRKELTGQEWQAVLTVGSAVVAQSTFTEAGEVKGPRKAISAGPTQDMFGALMGGDEASDAAGHLTAEFIDYEIRTPGQPPHVERRTLFDWIGPMARQSDNAQRAKPSVAVLDLATQVDILAVIAQPSPEYVQSLMATSLLAQRGALVRLARDPVAAQQTAVSLSRGASGFSGDLYALALARHQWRAGQDRIYFSEVNVLTQHHGFSADPAGVVQAWHAFDIVHNAVAVLGSDAETLTNARFAQGILDTNAEALMGADPAAPILSRRPWRATARGPG